MPRNVDLEMFVVLARKPVERQRFVDVLFDPAGERRGGIIGVGCERLPRSRRPGGRRRNPRRARLPERAIAVSRQPPWPRPVSASACRAGRAAVFVVVSATARLMMRGAVAVAVSPQSSPRRYGDRQEARGNIRELVGGSGQDPSPGSSPLKPPLQGVCDHQALVSQTGVGLLQPPRPE